MAYKDSRLHPRYLTGPTWVYQALCEHNGLLYVGVASDLNRRIAQHRATKSWWPEVWAVAAGLYPTRSQALAIEAELIRGAGQGPAYNIAGRPSTPTPSTGSDRSLRWVLVDGFGQPMEAAT